MSGTVHGRGARTRSSGKRHSMNTPVLTPMIPITTRVLGRSSVHLAYSREAACLTPNGRLCTHSGVCFFGGCRPERTESSDRQQADQRLGERHRQAPGSNRLALCVDRFTSKR